MKAGEFAKRYWQDLKLVKKAGVEIKMMPLRLGVMILNFFATEAVFGGKGQPNPNILPLPEPLNYFEHATNFAGSLAITNALGWGLASAYARVAENPTVRKARAVAAIAPLILTVANVVFETRWGVRITRESTIPDPLDLAWGAAGTALGAAAVQQQIRRAEPTVQTITEPLDNYWHGSSYPVHTPVSTDEHQAVGSVC
ncbi:MAG TPA: hypothetical protein VLF69_01210 [Candidatus Saccharimonadales bacterium]|nr:hypothetical protein [Candidatus Saccharimonadales bacterium]